MTDAMHDDVVCRTYSVLDMNCEANVTKQPVMLVLLFILAIICCTFWVECTFLRGKHLHIFRAFPVLHQFLRGCVREEESIPKYWMSIISFLLGQLTSYMSNLGFEEKMRPFIAFVSGTKIDPLDAYFGILVHDDIIGSLFRFLTWSITLAFLKRKCGQEKSTLFSGATDKHLFLSIYGQHLNVGYAAFRIAAWMIQVFLSNVFAFMVASFAVVLAGSYAPVVMLSLLFSKLPFSTCSWKTLALAISIRFSLECVHAAVGPYLIREWSGSDDTDLDATQTKNSNDDYLELDEGRTNPEGTEDLVATYVDLDEDQATNIEGTEGLVATYVNLDEEPAAHAVSRKLDLT